MTSDDIQRIRVPDDASVWVKIGLVVTKFLVHHNRLDGWMALAGIWWGLLTLLMPGFWGSWPVTDLLTHRTGGHPWLISWFLLASGLMSYVTRYCGRKKGPRQKYWFTVRSFFSLLALASWTLLAWTFVSVRPVFSPGFACYSLFAFAKLISYVNFVVRVDQLDGDDVYGT